MDEMWGSKVREADSEVLGLNSDGWWCIYELVQMGESRFCRHSKSLA